MSLVLATKDLVFDESPYVGVYISNDDNFQRESDLDVFVEANNEQKVLYEESLFVEDNIAEHVLDEWQQIVLHQNIQALTRSISEESEFMVQEKIQPPTERVVNDTKFLLKELSYSSIYPYKLGVSAEEGVCLTFDHFYKKMYFEIYNDDEIGYIIEDKLTGKPIQNIDLESIHEGIEVIEKFYWNNAFSKRANY